MYQHRQVSRSLMALDRLDLTNTYRKHSWPLGLVPHCLINTDRSFESLLPSLHRSHNAMFSLYVSKASDLQENTVTFRFSVIRTRVTHSCPGRNGPIVSVFFLKIILFLNGDHTYHSIHINLSPTRRERGSRI